MAQASVEFTSLKNTVVFKLLSQVIEVLISGELMQLGVKEISKDRLTHYPERYRKTASLMEQSCKASSYLNVPDFFERHKV